MARLLAVLLTGLLSSLLAAAADRKTVVVTGATGKSGSLFYKRLKAENISNVRAFVRSTMKARNLLGCTACDESEGVFVGDILDPQSMAQVMHGADVLAIFTSSAPHCNGFPFGPFGSCNYTKGAEPNKIDFLGTKLQVAAFASSKGTVKSKHILYMGTMDTTAPDNFLDQIASGYVSFYHLQGEVSIMSSGIPFTIAKACGLGNKPGGTSKLSIGHNDETFSFTHMINRDDVARVLVEAVRYPEEAQGLRFDICSEWFGSPTTDIVKDVFNVARYPWDVKNRDSRQFVV